MRRIGMIRMAPWTRGAPINALRFRHSASLPLNNKNNDDLWTQHWTTTARLRTDADYQRALLRCLDSRATADQQAQMRAVFRAYSHLPNTQPRPAILRSLLVHFAQDAPSLQDALAVYARLSPYALAAPDLRPAVLGLMRLSLKEGDDLTCSRVFHQLRYTGSRAPPPDLYAAWVRARLRVGNAAGAHKVWCDWRQDRPEGCPPMALMIELAYGLLLAGRVPLALAVWQSWWTVENTFIEEMNETPKSATVPDANEGDARGVDDLLSLMLQRGHIDGALLIYHTLKAAPQQQQQHRHAHAALRQLHPSTLRLLLRETLRSPAAPLHSAQDIVATMRALDHRGTGGRMSVPVSLRVRLFLKRWGL